jgi:hypothetical protein
MSVRYVAAAIRALSPAAAFGLTLAALLGVTGVADAANSSGVFVLGHANSESATASLANTKGTPLSLSAPKNTAPLVVNRGAVVKNLNAQSVGGTSAAGLELSGGDGFSAANADIAITGDVFTKVAGTPNLAAGNYYVTATALVNVTPPDTGATCVLEKDNSGITFLAEGNGDGTHFVQASESIAVSLPKGGSVQELCMAKGTTSGTEVIDAGILAIRISSSHGTKPATR